MNVASICKKCLKETLNLYPYRPPGLPSHLPAERLCEKCLRDKKSSPVPPKTTVTDGVPTRNA